MMMIMLGASRCSIGVSCVHEWCPVGSRALDRAQICLEWFLSLAEWSELMTMTLDCPIHFTWSAAAAAAASVTELASHSAVSVYLSRTQKRVRSQSSSANHPGNRSVSRQTVSRVSFFVSVHIGVQGGDGEGYGALALPRLESFRENSKFGKQGKSPKIFVFIFKALLFDFIHNNKIMISHYIHNPFTE